MAQEVISFQYTLTDKNGVQLDASEKGHPLIFLSGAGQIIPGLEKELMSLKAGDKRTLTVPAKEAYGEYDPKLIYKAKTSQLPRPDVKKGDMFEVGSNDQYFPVQVTDIQGEDVTLDGNHPLAGQDLTFAIELTERRPATADEITHGHVHGTGGCQH